MKDKNNNENQTIIGLLVKVKGDFYGDGDVIIEGELKGSITTKQNLNIGEEAIVEANIQAENAHIAGRVKGNLKIKNSLELAKTSQIDGDISCKNLKVESGSVLNGKCTMSENKELDKPNE